MAIEDWLPQDFDEWVVYHEPECSRCGRTIYWVHRDKWIPFDPRTEKPHDCPARRASAREFPNLGEE